MQSLLQNITRPQAEQSNPTMAGYITSVRNKIGTYLTGEVDGETEDDTIICRALRKHYSDPAHPQPFPAWLPPDPKAPPPPPMVQPVYTQPGVGSTYGASNQGSQLKDLFGNGRGQEQQGLRGTPPPQGHGLRTTSMNDTRRPGMASRDDSRFQSEALPRPLPSQSQSSYQRPGSGMGNDAPASAGSSAGVRSASDLLKDRLRNKGKPKMASNSGSTGSANYEDRFAPGGGGSGEKPYMGASSPWATSEPDYGGGGSYGSNSRGVSRGYR